MATKGTSSSEATGYSTAISAMPVTPRRMFLERSSSVANVSAEAAARSALGALLAAASALTFATLLLRSKNILRGVTGMALMAVEYPVASLLLVPFVAMAYARG